LSLATALRTGDVTKLPGKRDEDWRWTDLRGLLRVLPPASPESGADLPAGPFGELGEAEIAIVNGRIRGDAGVLNLPAGAARAVRLRFVSDSAETSHAARLDVRVADGARLTLLESYEGLAGGYVADATLDITLAGGAALERIVIANEGEGAVAVSTAEISLSPCARLAQTVLTDGARRQRIETRVSHPGDGAAVRLDSAYLLAGQLHADLTSAVTHDGLNGATSQLTKGVVRDQSRGVFQGRIVVAEGADGTDARMGHHALILSDRAEVDAKPELLIFADDVQCAHGNTIGALDEDALFYAEQRGMPEDVARGLLTQAFVGEVVDRIEHEGAREAARAWVAARLGS
jgi:Fe-S cluster assembly protein SufD